MRVVLAQHVVAESRAAFEVLETSHPPTIYFPPVDVDLACLVESTRSSFCEWKGAATYFDVVVENTRRPNAAWSYRKPLPEFEAIAGHICFYPSRFDCFYGEERVVSQDGDFYGGWVHSGLAGPFKGERGTSGW